MTAPMTPKLDQARLRELAEAARDEKEAFRQMSEEQRRAPGVPAFWAPWREYTNATPPETILALLDALSAERERGDRAVGLLRRIDCSAIPIEMSSPLQWSVCGKTVQDASCFLATQKAEGA